MSEKRPDVLEFYYRSVAPVLSRLESQRRGIVKKIVLAAIVGFAAILFYWLNLSQSERDADALITPMIAGTAFLGMFADFLKRGYRRRFQRDVLGAMVGWIDPSMHYDPNGSIPITLFKRSGLFPSRIDGYRGKNYVEGRVEGVALRFSDLEVTRKVKKDEEATIFRGTFVVTDFPKSFTGSVYVYPDYAERYLGLVGSWFQRMGNADLVKLDSPAFEKAFKVVAEDTVTAHYLLTPDIMERILSFQKSVGAPVYFSFVGKSLYIALANDGEWFEPTLFEPIGGLENFRRYLQNFQRIFGLVEQLKLNQNIWR